MSAHDQTTPVALHRLISRLLDDHQRIYPHHVELCPLCKDACEALDLLADEMPDDLLPDGSDTGAAAWKIPLGVSSYQLSDGAVGGSYSARPPNQS